MNYKCGGLGCMMIILFLPASSTVLSGRPHQLKVRTASTRSNATALDESKFTMIFCQERYCKTEPHECYCCLPTELCYLTQSECRAACHNCNPKCPT
ncbi:hypothetical protein HU200_066723 [Digitaria exilis]|uniref:Meg domain-containing protein n=1 Tax=Digitaria exilis TaxID=1010633 RepID=A0A834ZXN2_9POAL|nr:hypothetical protein HU200_066723 [Digitaria exilis]